LKKYKNNLVVDLDQSLLKIDLFKEVLAVSLINNPRVFFKTILLAIYNKAKAKDFLAKNTKIVYDTLPYDNLVIDIIANYRAKGFQILLATGAPKEYALPIAKHLGLFDNVIATDENKNNVGGEKLEAIRKTIGDDFIYLADSKKDLPIWLHCKKAILVGKNNVLQKEFKKNGVEIIDEINTRKSFLAIIAKQLRIHQWSKNILVFVPAIAGHSLFEEGIFFEIFLAFCTFCLISSGIYIINDIHDIDSDRKHPINKDRPITSGQLPVNLALFISMIMFIIGAMLTLGLGFLFSIVISSYILLNIIYTCYIKQVIILDLILLMTFYTIRLLAGYVSLAVLPSPWLLSFSIFLFFSLGLLKRYIEIILLQEKNVVTISGRGYSLKDSNILMTMGVSSSIIAGLVLLLYTGSENVTVLYNRPIILIALVPIYLYWITWMWLMAERGKMESDPVIFAVKNKSTYIVLACLIIVGILAGIK